MPDNQIKPTGSLDRIPSLDFLRGTAILGILFINAENFAYPDSWSPWKYGFETPADYSTRFWVYFLTQGKFYTMFALLFGVGFMAFLYRLEKKNAGLKALDIYAKRLLWLFVMGVAHAYFIWDGDVLYHYAICGLLLIPFRSIRNKYLVLIVLFFACFPLIKSYELTTKRQKSKQEYLTALRIVESKRTKEEAVKIGSWEKIIEKKSPDTGYVAPKRPTYWEGLKESYGHVKVHKGEFYYQSLIFSSLIVMIIGMILYRTGIFLNYRVWKHYWLIGISVLAIGLVINYIRFYHWTYEYYKPVTNIWQGYLFTFPKEILGIGYILIVNGIYQKFLINFRIKIISKIGRTALSNYILQNIILGLIFYGYGLALFNRFSRVELLGVVLFVWIIQIVFTWLWLKKHNQGPLEWIWRRLTYSSFIKKVVK